MFLKSYVHAGCGDIEMLDPAVIAAMAPIWTGRMPSDELIGIGATGVTTGALITWPLADFHDQEAAARFLHAFLETQCRGLWLLAFTENPGGLTEPLRHLEAAAADLPYRLDGLTLAVTGYGRQWATVSHESALADGSFQPVAQLDPVAARMWLLATRAGREQTRTLSALRAHPDPETAAVQARAEASIHQMREGIDGAVRAAEDAAALQRALAEPDVPNVRDAVWLGLALADDSALLAAAIDATWTADSTSSAHFELWQRLAEVATADAHATATALTALAAWRTGDLAFATAALEYATGSISGHSPLIGWLCGLIAHGVPAAALHAGAPLIPGHLRSGATGSEA